MTTPTREKGVTRTVLKHLNELPGCYARKVGATQYGTNGEPDIDACLNGRTLKIEMKAPGKKSTVTPIQELAQERWRRAGALVLVADSWPDVEQQLIDAGFIGAVRLAKHTPT